MCAAKLAKEKLEQQQARQQAEAERRRAQRGTINFRDGIELADRSRISSLFQNASH